MYLNPKEYVKRALLIAKLRGDSQTNLLLKQANRCPTCNKFIID